VASWARGDERSCGWPYASSHRLNAIVLAPRIAVVTPAVEGWRHRRADKPAQSKSVRIHPSSSG
jgi:hypothetical protein